MKISARSIEALGKLVTGDNQITPYKSGPKLVEFFNSLGFNDRYPTEGGFPTRWKFTEEKLSGLNGTPAIREAIISTLDPRNFIEFAKPIEESVAYLNKFLRFDDYEVFIDGKTVQIRSTGSTLVAFDHPYKESAEITHVFIEEQINKCEKKIAESDFDGAITNSRSLLEAVLVALEKDLSPCPESYDGDLPKIFRRVQKLLNLDPSRKDISDAIKQILSGLTSIVNGLATLRNKMSDAHATNSRASRHHAKLAVNSAKTLAEFLFESKNFQQQKGKIAIKQ